MLQFSEKAINTLLSELRLYPDLETGGVLLGYTRNMYYFAEEIVCGGKNAIREPGRFMYDSDYVERRIEQLLKEHDYNLQLLGLWHKHNHTNEPAFSIQDKYMHEQLLTITAVGISCLFQKREDGSYQLQVLDKDNKIKKSNKIWTIS